MQTQELLIRIAGGLHFGILFASALVPHVLDWRRELRSLGELSRHIVWVHGTFIVLVIVGFGVLCLVNAAELAAGTPLARSTAGLIAVFWLARLAVQLLVFDARPYLRSAGLKIGHHGLTLTFAFIGIVLAWTALAPAPAAAP